MIDDWKKGNTNELSLNNIKGIFLVVGSFLCLSILISIVEFIWKAKKTSNLRFSKLKLIIISIMKNFFKKRFENVFKKRKNYCKRVNYDRPSRKRRYITQNKRYLNKKIQNNLKEI